MIKISTRLEKISKFLALVLRHKPDAAGITLDKHGWADVNELVRGIRSTKDPTFTHDDLTLIVVTDSKGRYSFDESGKRIRANQGHSVKVDVELEELEPPLMLYHGTATKYMNSIEAEGLIPKSRLYVHLSDNVKTATDVGSRHGKPVVYAVHAHKMFNDGYKFYKSVNGVWLTREVPTSYLGHRIFDLTELEETE